MGLLDGLTGKLTGKKVENISVEKMVELVKEHFIKGASNDYLEELRKTVHGRSSIMKNELQSPDKKRSLTVHNDGSVMNLVGRDVWMNDEEAKILYQIRKADYKKFRDAVYEEIDKAK